MNWYLVLVTDKGRKNETKREKMIEKTEREREKKKERTRREDWFFFGEEDRSGKPFANTVLRTRTTKIRLCDVCVIQNE